MNNYRHVALNAAGNLIKMAAPSADKKAEEDTPGLVSSVLSSPATAVGAGLAAGAGTGAIQRRKDIRRTGDARFAALQEAKDVEAKALDAALAKNKADDSRIDDNTSHFIRTYQNKMKTKTEGRNNVEADTLRNNNNITEMGEGARAAFRNTRGATNRLANEARAKLMDRAAGSIAALLGKHSDALSSLDKDRDSVIAAILRQGDRDRSGVASRRGFNQLGLVEPVSSGTIPASYRSAEGEHSPALGVLDIKSKDVTNRSRENLNSILRGAARGLTGVTNHENDLITKALERAIGGLPTGRGELPAAVKMNPAVIERLLARGERQKALAHASNVQEYNNAIAPSSDNAKITDWKHRDALNSGLFTKQVPEGPPWLKALYNNKAYAAGRTATALRGAPIAATLGGTALTAVLQKMLARNAATPAAK